MNKEIMKSYYPYDLRVINPSTSSTIYRIKERLYIFRKEKQPVIL